MITAAQECEKYTKIWQFKDYRKNSPGEDLIDLFKRNVPYEKLDTIIDLGCGTGRAALALARLGLVVSCLDIAENCMDPRPREVLPFVRACLWEPLSTPWDWFYCTDVMEHIPPEHVEAVLDNIKSTATKGGMFQIAMFKESYGDLIGDTLHLTIKPDVWWLEQLKSRWDNVKVVQNQQLRLVVVVQA